MSTDERADDDAGPRPGAARDAGPRPYATPRDLAWASLATTIALVTVLQLAGMVMATTRPGFEISLGGLVLAFLVTVGWLLTIYWVVLGAWRRSVWGCPFHHRADDPDGRPDPHRCPRHATVTSHRRPAGDDDAPGARR